MVQGPRDAGRPHEDLPHARGPSGDTDDLSRVPTSQEIAESGPQVGELVRVDEWVRNMIVDHLRLTDFPCPSYDSHTVARLERDDIAVILDVAVIDGADGMSYDKYYRILGPGGVGWVGSNYVESAENDA